MTEDTNDEFELTEPFDSADIYGKFGKTLLYPSPRVALADKLAFQAKRREEEELLFKENLENSIVQLRSEIIEAMKLGNNSITCNGKFDHLPHTVQYQAFQAVAKGLCNAGWAVYIKGHSSYDPVYNETTLWWSEKPFTWWMKFKLNLGLNAF
jgi:hypothetical protein